MTDRQKSLPSRADVVIVGGGVIGLSIAYYLTKKGVKGILVLEKGMLGEGSTAKCAGGIRTHFSTEINIRCSMVSLKVFEGFKEEFGADPEFHRVGYLFMASAEAQWALLRENARLLARLGLEAELPGPSEMQRRWPFLRVDDLAGGAFTPDDGYAGPYEVLQGFAKKARQGGAVIREHVEVTGIRVTKGRVQAVDFSGGMVRTPVVINAAGPYAARIAAMAGLDLPVFPLRRQIFFTDLFDDLPAQFPMFIDMEHGWYMRREGRGLLLAGPQDAESSFSEKVDFEAREWTAERGLHRVPVLEKARIARGWAGLYEISPDHHAVMGAFPEVEGFICANGFSGHGFQHSPAAGILISELVTEGEARTLDIHSLRPARFREGDLIHEPLTAFRD